MIMPLEYRQTRDRRVKELGVEDIGQGRRVQR